MTRLSSIAFIVTTGLGLCMAGNASAQPARWHVIKQPGGYKVARVAAPGLVSGMAVTCERGIPVIAVSLRRVPPRNSVRTVIAIDGAEYPIGLVRNLTTNVWVAGVRDQRLLDAMAGGSAAEVSVEGTAYGATSLTGTREAFAAALSGCYRVPAQAAATATTSAPVPVSAPSYDIVVKIAFTPWAAQYVAKRPQRLVISALYSGEPIPSRQRAVDREEGTITIGEHFITVPARAATVRLTGATINRQRLSWITRLDVEVAAMVEVWEERWKVECTPTGDSASGPLSTVQARGVTITCDRAPQY